MKIIRLPQRRLSIDRVGKLEFSNCVLKHDDVFNFHISAYFGKIHIIAYFDYKTMKNTFLLFMVNLFY